MHFTYQHTKLACYASYISSAVVNNFAALLFVIFTHQFGLCMLELSFLITLNFCVQMLVDFLGAKYVDKIGYRKSIVAANVFSALGLAALGILPQLMPAFSGLCCAVILYAIGSGLMEVLVSPIVEAIPSDGKAASMSFLHSFYCWGQMLTVLNTTAFFVLFGQQTWPVLCVLWAILPMLTALLFTRVPIHSFTDEETKVPMRKLFGMKVFWIFLILMLCSGASELTMAQWASLFAETALGVSKTVGDLFGPCLFAITMGISRVLYGKFADKVSLTKYIILSAMLCVVSYLLVSICRSSVLSLTGCALCGFSVGVMWPGVLSLAAVKCPEGGTAIFALLAMAGDIGCFAGPALAAQVSEHHSLLGSPLKAGLFAAVVFPIVLILGTYLLKNKKDERKDA